MIQKIWKSVEAIKNTAPVIHNITNLVVMNNTANALLALGASPIMSHAIEELKDIIKISNATVINIGTLDSFWLISMKEAMRYANGMNHPVVLDPVGAGASVYRNQALREILNSGTPQFIRGNASEILSLGGAVISSKGVDSVDNSLETEKIAQELSIQYNCVVCVSGEIDLVVDQTRVTYLKNGSPMMSKVTGLGCVSTALLAAFASVEPDNYQAAISATAVMGICGEIAAEMSQGPGSLQLNLLDVFYNLQKDQLASKLKMDQKTISA